MEIYLLRHGIAADPEQIRHRMGTSRIGVTEILRCTREFGLKARAQRSSWNRLGVTPLPAIGNIRADDSCRLLSSACLDADTSGNASRSYVAPSTPR